MFTLGLLAGAALVALYVLIRSAVRVDAGSVGVLTVFGRFVRGADNKLKTLPPGTHAIAPWAKPVVVSLAERSIGLGADDAAVEILASDGTRMRVGARLRFRVERDRVGTYLADTSDPVEHLRGLFRLTMREQIARFETRDGELASYTALRLRLQELQGRVHGDLAGPALQELGITITAVDLLQIDPPEELVDALNAVVGAESEAAQLVARTDLTSQQRALAAEHAVEIAQARAAAQESEILTIGAELGVLQKQGVLAAYVERRRAEVLGGSSRVYLNHTLTAVRS